MKRYGDIAIIGAGPIGLYAQSCAGMLGLSGFIIESNNKVGGQVSELFPEKNLFDIPGINKITGEKLINNLKKQTNAYGKKIKLLLERKIKNLLQLEDKTYDILLSDNSIINIKTILITSGNGNFNPIKLEYKSFNNEETYFNLDYFVHNIKKYNQQKVVIFGGGNSALDWANYFVEKQITKDVILVHRRENYRAQNQTILQLQKNHIKELKPYQISQIDAENRNIKSITIKNLNNQKEIIFDNCFFLVQYGSKVGLSAINQWPLEFTKINKIKIDCSGKTKMANVFAAGNCVSYEGKYYNLSTGFGEAMTALVAISKILYGEKYNPEYLSLKISSEITN